MLSRAPKSRLGLNRVGLTLAAINFLFLCADLALYTTLGLSIEWGTAARGAMLLAVLATVWVNFYLTPGREQEWFIAELVFVLGMILVLTNLASLFQYAAVALGLPYADPWLAAADAAIGVHVPTLAVWTGSHPRLNTILTWAYFSFAPQMLIMVGILAVARDRVRVLEFGFHFHFCLMVSVAALVPFPAVCPPAHYGFTPTIDMTHLIGQIKQLHEGALRVVRFDELEGLVSFPSFHVAGALATTWALRGRRWWFPLFAGLNLLLVFSTFMTGVHYIVDVIASFPLFAASVLLYRRYFADAISPRPGLS
jgi:hypothetical protein